MNPPPHPPRSGPAAQAALASAPAPGTLAKAATGRDDPVAGPLADELLVEEISIDGMCGVY